jgi:long-chain acyl-CoA synthetase
VTPSETMTVAQAARARASVGMEIAAVAAMDPHRPAIISEYGSHSFKTLNDRANQIAHLLRERGYQPGDSIAILCSNRLEFPEVRFAAHRLGARLTTVNWHLAPEEAAYIVDNCDAMALFADVRCREAAEAGVRLAGDKLKLSLAIGGDIDGCEEYDTLLSSYPTEDIDNPSLGSIMQYTSGTTGRPKGVLRQQPDPEAAAAMQEMLTLVFQFDPECGTDMSLVCGPLYHSGPFNLGMTTPLTAGIGAVLMDRWEPEKCLRLIERHRITHMFMVPTMFMRLLVLPVAARAVIDVSSIKFVIHGAAPISRETKQDMLDWFGPVLWEIFAGTEAPGTIVSPQDWLAHPGTVGKPGPEQMKICDSSGEPVEAGMEGEIYWINPRHSSFEYYKSPEKTAAGRKGEFFTVGDIGYVDTEGWLFITGRSAECIISGGVNLYPQEIDELLLKHPAVADVACVGVPHADLGEQIKAVVQLAEGEQGTEALAAQLLEFVQPRLAQQKWPRSVDFVGEIPRSEAGKVYRRRLRDSYWQDRDMKI